MPTVILLDVSLSMQRPVPQVNDCHEIQTRYTLATAAISTLLDYLSVHAKLEYVALVTFSSFCEVSCVFTRDYASIKNKVRIIDEVDTTNVDRALVAVNHLVVSEWGNQTPIQIVLVTDGVVSRQSGSTVATPTYPCRLHVFSVSTSGEQTVQHSTQLYNKLIESMCAGGMQRGSLFTCEQLTTTAVCAAMSRLCTREYSECVCRLRCGRLEARVCLQPPPSITEHYIDSIDILGFVTTQELGTPVISCKHVIIPMKETDHNTSGSNNTNNNSNNNSNKSPSSTGSGSSSGADVIQIPEDDGHPSRTPNFCVLLHGALKVESMACVVRWGNNKWGSISVWAEALRSRKSCLVLAVWTDAPWLGPYDRLGPLDEEGEQFPVRSLRSYSTGVGTPWSRPASLLADVHKVLRHARKLPDKAQHFYKELNRIRRAAISLGFTELLLSLATMLERECVGVSNNPADIQLTHAAAALRDPRTAFDAKRSIAPPVFD